LLKPLHTCLCVAAVWTAASKSVCFLSALQCSQSDVLLWGFLPARHASPPQIKRVIL